MQINKNIFTLEKTSEEYKTIENILVKIAEEQGVENVKTATVSLSTEEGVIVFKEAEDKKDKKKDDKDKSKGDSQKAMDIMMGSNKSK